MVTSIADVSCTPIGPPLLKSRPPLQTQVSNTTNIRVPDRGIAARLPAKRAESRIKGHAGPPSLGPSHT
ncbi:hypothetical protein TNCV_2669361 [Trichonephila clavipes]|nr:hypothetical protein TNCV_2669361 [Trichonephila clavipes]